MNYKDLLRRAVGLSCCVTTLSIPTIALPTAQSPPSPQNWSNGSTWPEFNNLPPTMGADVVIPTGRHVLLDVDPPELGSIVIEEGGTLECSDIDFTLELKHIVVAGTFQIGSEAPNQYTSKAVSYTHLTLPTKRIV